MRVQLSCGHGYKRDSAKAWFDPGAQCNIKDKQITEHSVNKLVARYVKTLWEKKSGKVQLFISEFDNERTAMSNNLRAESAREYDVAVFIHHNSCSDKTVNRTEILYFGPSQQYLADIMAKNLTVTMPLPKPYRLVDLSQDKDGNARGKIFLEGSLKAKLQGTRCSLITEGFFLSYPFEDMEALHIMCCAEAKGILNCLYTMALMLEK